MRHFTNRLSLGLAATLVACAAVLAAPAAQAGEPKSKPIVAFVPPTLLEAAEAGPDRTFDVIVQGGTGKSSVAVAADAAVHGSKVKKKFSSIAGVAVQLTGRALVRLAQTHGITAITPDAAVRVSGYSSKQRWTSAANVRKTWGSSAPLPTIAVVDSGIDTSRPDVAGRVLESVTLTSRLPNSAGDGRGHGTFVASVAAGGAAEYAGAAPGAKVVSIDVVDDAGVAQTSDVIAAADWILANKERLGIRVANFSLQSSVPGSFLFDPLNKAVERLWFAGVVVVAAAGNYGTDAATDVAFAPGNDPFVITVGASDIRSTDSVSDDVAAPWSAYGYTLDGFAKPELGAPGRYLVAAVPPTSTLALERPDRVIAPGYMQLSGTSFAAPVVAGAAAYVLSLHPTWTPDLVKGALMATVRATSAAASNSLGVGSVDAQRAGDVLLPPNPNLALNAFVSVDPLAGGERVFDASSWTSAAQASATWDAASWTSASWTSASWTSASWTSASWTSASWTSASWTSASWTSASWTSASWTSASWTSASWTSGADDDFLSAGGYFDSLDQLLP